MATQKYVALLRGINVGGNNMVSMAVLKSLFENLGYMDVVTYINSGNVVFSASNGDPRQMEAAIEEQIYLQFGLKVSVVAVSKDDYEEIVKHIPESWNDKSIDQKLNVMFLRHEVDSPKILEGLKPKPGIEEVHYYPGVLFWSALSSDITKSAMLKIVGTPLYKQMTVRNFNTARKIWELMET